MVLGGTVLHQVRVNAAFSQKKNRFEKFIKPVCFEHRQASGPGSDLCVGKGVGRKFGGGLGDGSWCFNERRDITCSVPNQEEDEEEDEDEGNHHF